MRPSYVCLENRKGDKTTVNLMYTSRVAYCGGNIPKLFIDCGTEPFWVLAGAHMPDSRYDPDKDTIHVELIYEDGTIEHPYPIGHVNINDLYERLCHPTEINQSKDASA